MKQKGYYDMSVCMGTKMISIIGLIISFWLIAVVAQYQEHSGIFDPHGRVLPLDYATRAIEKHGGPVCAIAASDGIFVLIGTPRSSSRSSVLCLEEEVQKVHIVDPHALIAISGHSSEIHLPSITQLDQRYRIQFGSSIPIEMLCEEVAEVFHGRSKKSGSLPFRCQLVVCGHDEELGYQIYTINPDGSYDAWKGVAIGKDSSAFKQSLAKLEEEKSLQQPVEKLWPIIQQRILKKHLIKLESKSEEDGSEQAPRDDHQSEDSPYDIEAYVMTKSSAFSESLDDYRMRPLAKRPTWRKINLNKNVFRSS